MIQCAVLVDLRFDQRNLVEYARCEGLSPHACGDACFAVLLCCDASLRDDADVLGEPETSCGPDVSRLKDCGDSATCPLSCNCWIVGTSGEDTVDLSELLCSGRIGKDSQSFSEVA